MNPRTPSEDVLGTCSTGNDGSITIKAPLTCPGATSCDWILPADQGDTGGGSSPFAIDLTAGISDSKLNDVEVWTELSADSSTSAVLAQIIAPDGVLIAKPTVVSPDGISFQKLPTAARDTAGNFFIVWEAESPVTGLDEISAQWYDNEGNPLSEIFAVSAPASGQQAEPSVTADSYNKAAVSWTRYPLGDDPGSVKVQIFDAQGAHREGDHRPAIPSGRSGGNVELVQADGQGTCGLPGQKRIASMKGATSTRSGSCVAALSRHTPSGEHDSRRKLGGLPPSRWSATGASDWFGKVLTPTGKAKVCVKDG